MIILRIFYSSICKKILTKSETENAKVSVLFTTELSPKSMNVYKKVVTVSNIVWGNIIEKLFAQKTKNSYEKSFIHLSIEQKGDLYFPNLTQSKYLNDFILAENVEVNKSRLLSGEANTAYRIIFSK